MLQAKNQNFEEDQINTICDEIKTYKRHFTDDYEWIESGEELPPKKSRKSVKQDIVSSPVFSVKINPLKNEDNKFIYGNYSRYYGYRTTNFHDVRLDVFCEHKDLFKNKEILDIGCNTGFITMAISKQFDIKFITGIDIDKTLINKAKIVIQKNRKNFSGSKRNCFPFNIDFVYGNYVLKDDVLLEIEYPQYDLLLCLSVTKWIHLNFGDAGLKQAFRRMFIQLRPGGKLILEPQPWNGYKRRKKLTTDIFNNYKSIKFFPKDFNDYLLGPEVGFREMYELQVPECSKGFKRPIYVFIKDSG